MVVVLKKFFFGIFLLFFISCGHFRKIDNSQFANVNENKTELSLSKSLPYQPTVEKKFDLIHTELDVSFNWQKKQLLGVATIWLKPHFYAQSVLELDAKYFDLEEVKWIKDEKDTVLLSFHYDSLKLKLDFNQKIEKTDTIQILIKYIANPERVPSEGSRAISSRKGLYFINPDSTESKPTQIWTQGETEASSCWFPTLDSPNQKTTQKISITIDSVFNTLSNGTLLWSIENGNGTRTDVWEQRKPHSPYLFMMSIGDFAVIKPDYEKIDLAYYVEKEFAEDASRTFGNTPEMIEFFSELLGVPFPWDKYSQIVVRDYVSGAMENTSASLFMEQLNQTDREAIDKNWDYIIAHELFHQWFGDLVTCENWGQLSLNESFANYSEYLWEEYKYGIEDAVFYGIKETNDYLEEAESKKLPIVRFNYKHREDMFDSHSYNKGGRVLHMLRKKLGDEAFFLSLRDYLERNAFGSAELENLRLSFEYVTGLDLKSFFNQWFYKPGHPDLDIKTTVINDSLYVEISQRQDTISTIVYDFELNFEYYDGDNVNYESIIIDKTTNWGIYSLKKSYEGSSFNLGNEVLCNINQKKDIEDLLSQYRLTKDYYSRYEAVNQISSKFKDDQQNMSNDSLFRQGLSLILLDSSKYILRQGLGLLYQIDTINNQELESVKKLTNHKDSRVRNLAFRILQREDSTGIKYAFFHRLAMSDPSWMVFGQGLDYALKMDVWNKDSLVAAYLKESNVTVAKVLGNHFKEENDSTKMEWFNEKLKLYSNQNFYKFIQVYAEYMNDLGTDSSKRINIELYYSFCMQDDLYEKLGGYRALCIFKDDILSKDYREHVKKLEKNEAIIEYYKYFDSLYAK